MERQVVARWGARCSRWDVVAERRQRAAEPKCQECEK